MTNNNISLAAASSTATPSAIACATEASASVVAAQRESAFSPARHAQIALLKDILRKRADCSATHHLLYNLLRDLSPRRGFSPPKRRGASTNVALLHAAGHVTGLAKTLDIDWLPEWTAAIVDTQRQAHLEDFEASCEPGQEPSVTGALWAAMRLTPHGPCSNVLEHGQGCWYLYRALLTPSKEPADSSHPEWLQVYGDELRKRQLPLLTMREYLVSHDCGKVAVFQRDADGRAHFPDHAARSAQMWRKAKRSHTEARLMELDMALHTLPVGAMAEFAKDPLAPSLLLATFAQLQSNASSVFGGTGSDSYKIKLKALNKRANALVAAWGFEAAAAA